MKKNKNNTLQLISDDQPYPKILLEIIDYNRLLDTKVILAEELFAPAKTVFLEPSVYTLYWVGIPLESSDVFWLWERGYIKLCHIHVLINAECNSASVVTRDREKDVYAFRTPTNKYFHIKDEMLSAMFKNVKIQHLNRDNITVIKDRVLSTIPEKIFCSKLRTFTKNQGLLLFYFFMVVFFFFFFFIKCSFLRSCIRLIITF